MATQVQLRRGNTSQTNAFTGAVAEITVDTDKETVVVHDGSTAGGFPLARESALSANLAFTQAAFNDTDCAVRKSLDDRWVEETRDRVRHLPLQFDEFLRHRLRRSHVADAPTGHRVTLAHAIDRDRAARERGV